MIEFWKTDSEFQSAALSISLVVTPATAAAEVAAPRTECALKIEVSTPDLSTVIRSHRAIVEDNIGLCGFIVPRKSLCFRCSAPSLKVFCNPLIGPYSNVVTGQIHLFCGKAGKKKLDICSFCLDCFDSSAA